MKKTHIQCRTSLMKLATVARAMHRAGLHLNRPSDILEVALDAAEKLFKAEPFFREDEAEEYLQRTGFRSPDQLERRKVIIATFESGNLAREELEDLIENVRRAPGSVTEIKEMLAEPVIVTEEGGKDA